jgi:hypothetical protein
MNMMQLAGTWYVFIGLVWAYLLIHEYVSNGSFKKQYADNNAGGVMFIVFMFICGAIAWPLSLWKHIRAGKVRDLFV